MPHGTCRLLDRGGTSVTTIQTLPPASEPSPPPELHNSSDGGLGFNRLDPPARNNAELPRAASTDLGTGGLRERGISRSAQVGVRGAMPRVVVVVVVVGVGPADAVHGEGPGVEEAGVAAAAGAAGGEVRQAQGVPRGAQAQHRLRRGPVPQHRRGITI